MSDIARDAEALSSCLNDLQKLILSASPTLSTAIRALAEPLSFLDQLDSTVSETVPQWSGPPATTTKRIYFIQHLLPNHLDFILDNITVDWLSVFSSTQSTTLFDASFVPYLSRRSNDWNDTIAMISLQALVGRIHNKFNENHSFLNKTILRLLRKLLEHYSLSDFYRACIYGRSTHDLTTKDTAATERSSGSNPLWESFVVKLFSIPTRISNVFGVRVPGTSAEQSDVDQCFQETFFFKRQASDLHLALDSLSRLKGSPRIQYAQAFGAVVGKFLRLGHGRVLAESLVSRTWDAESTSAAAGWRIVLEHTSASTTHTFLTAMTEYLNANMLDHDRLYKVNTPEEKLSSVHKGANLLVALGFGIDGPLNSMVADTLFQGKVYGAGVLRMLICIQSGWPNGVQSENDSILASTFKRALSIWSDAIFAKHSAAEYQKYISYQLLLMIPYFDRQIMYDMDLIGTFGSGMSNWLDMEKFQRKTIGLVVAEEFSKASDTIGSPANFDLDKTPEVGFARSLAQLKDGAKPFQPVHSSGLRNDAGDNEATFVSHTVQDNAPHDSNSDDEEDPDAIVDQFLKFQHAENDDSSDDDLRPYEMDSESDPDEDPSAIRKPKVAAPLYLRDLHAYIRASEDREKAELGLDKAAQLIRRKAGSLELEEYAEQLTSTLIQLQDTFETENFHKLRENAVVALVVTMPEIASGVLTFQFYEKKNSIGQRLAILTALSIGAQELAGFDRPPPAATNLGKKPNTHASTPASGTSSALSHSPQNPSFDSITATISLAQTRRFSQKSNVDAKRTAPRASPFAKVAPMFLGGLLGRWGGNRGAGRERGYDVLQRAPVMVLKKFVVTLGVLMYYAGNSPQIIPMTKELFRFLLALRYHTPTPTMFPPKPSIPRVEDSLSAMFKSASVGAAPTLTSLKLPGMGEGSSSGHVSGIGSTTHAYNGDLTEAILFDLLILVTPSVLALSDELFLHEFQAEIMEVQQWAMGLWEHPQDGNEKSRMYCAALLQRCFELLKIAM